ncbi:MAG: trypsin-like peptidase domain-containing protein [Paracoccaceae bacterium]|nr:trypsin-like peptidase domain-containing protein [Paracoccaceae bacterium]
MAKFFWIIFLSFLYTKELYADATNAWENASPSVVSIAPTWPGYNKPGFGSPPGTAPEGTGIVLTEDGHILTASHVIEKAKQIKIRDISGLEFEAHLLFDYPKADLAIIKAEINIKPIMLAMKPPKIGSETCLISNSFGLNLSITCGVISAIGRKNVGFNQIEDFIQTDAASNPGSSGGALINSEGALIGMMNGIFTKNTDTNAGVNFAISLDLIKKTIPWLNN